VFEFAYVFTQKQPVSRFHGNKTGFMGTKLWGYGDKVTDSIRYQVDGDEQPRAIHLTYTNTNRFTHEKTDFNYTVRLTTTQLWWGSTRYWFLCPLTKNGVFCGRRVAAIYLPPRYQYFGCRHCYELTYRSSQEAHKYDNFYQRLAFQMQGEFPGCTGDDIEAILSGRLTANTARLATESYSQYWDDYDPHEGYLTRTQLMEESGLTSSDLDLLEEARLLLPDTKDERYRPKLAGWGRKLAYLIGEGWNLDEIKRWSKGRWSAFDPRQWPPNREEWM
jgi:hypothetical protein